MSKPILAGLAIVFCVSAHADGQSPDPEQWYREGYAPLWADRPSERVAEILTYYADEIETHEPDGTVSREPKVGWMPMDEWVAEGWIDSELTGLETDRINTTTATFKARWLDHYESGKEETTCGWYLAKLREGRWQFTDYADIDCADHDFQ